MLRILAAENGFPEVLRLKRNPGVMVMRSLIPEPNTSKEQIRTQLFQTKYRTQILCQANACIRMTDNS